MRFRSRWKPSAHRFVKMQVVLDTNVYISFLLTHGETISRILDAWENEEFTVLVSPSLLAEIHRVLEYPRLKTHIRPNESRTLIEALENDACLVEGALTAIGVTRDPKDDMVIACAVEGRADYIVSGDPDLVDLGNYKDIPIIAPANFIQILERDQHDHQS
ncbi:MAG: putative toxin-antitoxin system toxin component, PIN family [Chloroflexi bacterium]|nr:putative toxin-antitoxin system toxin component, PIN family [Chloroflexota bacterium]